MCFGCLFLLLVSTYQNSKEVFLDSIRNISDPPSDLSANPKKIFDKGYKNVIRSHYGGQHSVHTTLLDPMLANFYDDLRGISKDLPDKQDCLDAFKLSQLVCDKDFFVTKEDGMRKAIEQWAEDCQLSMKSLKIENGETDGSIEKYGALILNREDKFGGSFADIQNLMYYIYYWRNHKFTMYSLCPTLLMTVQGSDVTLSGALLTKDGIIADFYFSTSILPIRDDYILRSDLARMVMALRKGVNSLSIYYKKLQRAITEKEDKQKQRQNRNQKKSSNDKEQVSLVIPDEFPYVHQINDIYFNYIKYISRNVFLAVRMDNSAQIVIKFTRRYSKEAHESCSLAPTLLGIQEISGGWIAIAIEYFNGFRLNNLSQQQFDTIKAAVDVMHERGFVHGDLRIANILTNDQEIRIIDFDWSGLEGIATYPLHMNHVDITWPEGASDGKLIAKEHDKEFIKRLAMKFSLKLPTNY